MTTKTRRVGTLTMGVSLIAAGTLFLLHLFMPLTLPYLLIFRAWPVILILLGIEVMIANLKSKEDRIIYDGWAIFIMVLIMCLAGTMAGCQIILDHGIAQGYIHF